MSCLVLATTAKLINDLRFIEFSQLIVSDKYLLVSLKDFSLTHPFQMVLFILQIISVSLFILFAIETLRPEVVMNKAALYLQIIAFYCILVLGKFFFEKIVGTLFQLESVFEKYHFFKLSYRNYTGLILIPINAYFCYVGLPGKSLMLALIGALVIFHLISLFYVWKRFEQMISQHLFYFILYLCALEIAPYLLLYKWFA
ncbi:DUF4271 domain-containing protein [Croceiramulus getboli]|nr:DUF4271 domain-containing protein [Flavobacteriaceae bacterium YJPT1-3]